MSGWTGLRYLEEWTGIAKAFDIATGYFEIGALLALDGKWQALDKIRILLGAETTHRTRKALLEAIRSRAVQILDVSIESQKEANPLGELQVLRAAAFGSPALERLGAHTPALRQFGFSEHAPLVRCPGG